MLDVIAGYKTGGRITGDLTLNGLPKDSRIWTLLAGYAEQNDILNPYLTVLETLKFTASCRLPATMNRAAVIDNVISLMSLEDWVDFVVGVENEGEGIPKHVRKRLTIAVQLVMLPKILFLDVSLMPSDCILGAYATDPLSSIRTVGAHDGSWHLSCKPRDECNSPIDYGNEPNHCCDHSPAVKM